MRISAMAALLALMAGPILAQDKPDAKPKTETPDIPPPQLVATKHSGIFNGARISYVATAGDTYLLAEDGTPRATITSYSYVKEPRDPSRPVTFLFNGGPGSGSVWLHMGAFGPKRVVIPSDARDDGAPPYPVVPNPDSLLDVTDLVFIDPVGTGFSKALGKTDAKDFWGVTKDAQSVAEFIRLWLNRNGRWNSPKFLGGESYGTTRSAAVLNQLEGQYNDVALNGVILISTVLDFAAGADTPGNELSYIFNVPSMATTALFHGKAQYSGTPAQFAEEARRWAIGPYAAFLLQGNAAPGEQRAAIRRDLARFTGLNETYLESADMRVTPNRFYKELLRERGMTVGRLDSRYTGRDYDNAGESPDDDPSFFGIDGGYTAAINSYVRDELNFQTDRRYVTIGPVGPWDWRLGDGRDSDAYLNVAPYIGTALRKNSGLRIFVGQGWYDFATPFFAAEYALSRTGFPEERIKFHYYDAGHMMYVRDEDRQKLSRDVRDFIRGR